MTESDPLRDEPRRWRRSLLVGLLLAIVTVAIYARVGGHDFVNFDDSEYVYENPPVRDGLSWDGFVWAFTRSHSNNWHPLTWLSHMLDCQLFGLDAGAHHLVSVALHAVNAWLLFFAVALLTRSFWPSVLVALLFAVHPLRVESVAWVSERKDVLSGFFFMSTLLAYGAYVRRPAATRYALVAVAFTLGLLAKPMLVTVPLLLLLLDVWPLRRVDGAGGARLLLEKLPLLALAAASSIATVAVQSASGAVQGVEAVSIVDRLANTPVAYMMYVVKTLWPADLAVFYPHPALVGARQWSVVLGALLLLTTITLLALAGVRRRPSLAVGWFWFLGMLVPVIGLVQVGDQAWADRYAYLPAIGLYVVAVFGLHAALPSHLQRAASVVAVLACCIYGAVASRQVGFWRDSVTLYEHALQVTKDNHLAHNNLGTELRNRGELAAARAHFAAAQRIRPQNPVMNYGLGSVLAELGELKEAQRLLQQALASAPGYGDAHTTLGVVYAMDGQLQRARSQFGRALEIDPNDTDALVGLGTLLGQQDQMIEAEKQFRAAVAIDPAHVRANLNLAELHSRRSEWDAAARHLQAVLRRHPGNAEASSRLEQVKRRRGS